MHKMSKYCAKCSNCKEKIGANSEEEQQAGFRKIRFSAKMPNSAQKWAKFFFPQKPQLKLRKPYFN